MILALVEAMRPKQWVKNLLVFVPLLFAHDVAKQQHLLLDSASVVSALLGFVVFCLLSSSVYLINDVVDRDADRQHPRKKNRPIAAGRLPVPAAIAAFVMLSGGSLTAAATLGPDSEDGSLPFVLWPVAYFCMNLAYSFALKKVPIVDCLIIALGFLFRVHAGSVVIDVRSSDWLLLCTFFFALFLAFCKRRDEVVKVSDGSGATRTTMRYYTKEYIDQLMPSLAGLSILSYALYTVATETVAKHGDRDLLITVPVVVFGVFRYLFLVHTRGRGGEPSKDLFSDLSLLASGAVYLVLVWVALGGRKILG